MSRPSDDQQPQPAARAGQAADDAAKAELRALFAQMPHRVELILFAQPGRNEAYSQAARQAIRLMRDLSDKIGLREFPLDHEMARRHGVDRAPTILFATERANIRLLGAPIGEEGLSFVEAILMIGFGQAELSAQSRKILDSIDTPRQVQVFVSPTCPYCPQQAVNAIKAAVARPEMVDVSIVDVQANPDLAQAAGALATPTTLANGRLVAKGAQPEELFMLSVRELEQRNILIPEDDAPEVACDLVIVGGGPAGLTAAIYAARSGLSAVVVEKGTLGGQVATTPSVENYPGLTQVGGKALVDMMVAHALQYARIFPGEEVQSVDPGPPLTLTTTRRRLVSKALLLATGAVHRRLGVPGEDSLAGRGVSYCSTCDGPLFKGKSVVVVGGGDSAVTEALHLKQIGVDVSLVHRGASLRAQAHLAGQLEAVGVPVRLQSEIREIRGRDRVREVVLSDGRAGRTETLAVEGVFVAVGHQPETGLAGPLGLEMTPEGYVKVDGRHRTSRPGVYAAGDVTGGFKQIVTAAGQGSAAALAIFEDLVNPYWMKRREAAAGA